MVIEINLNNHLVKFLIIAVVLVFIIGAFFLLNNSTKQSIQDKNNTYVSENQTGKEIYFEEICSWDLSSDDKNKKTYVIKNQSTLETIVPTWIQNHCGNVDFNKNDVIGISLGAKRTGGYSVKISKVVETGDKLIVTSYSLEPSGIVSQASTHPISLYKIPKTNKQIIFVE